MILYTIALCALLVLSLMHIVVAVIHRKQWLSHIRSKEQEWSVERKDLLDRIQAPSFLDYTNKVIREKKVENPKEEPPAPQYVT